MAEKEPMERARQIDEHPRFENRQSLFTFKNLVTLLLGIVVSSLLAIFTVGNYIAPAIERKKVEQDSVSFATGQNADLEKLTFYQIGPVIVNPAESNGERYLKATMSLEAYDSEIVPEIEKRLPQIKNQINIILSSKTIDQIKTNEDRERLRREIQARVNGLLTTGNISNVYFEEFVYQ